MKNLTQYRFPFCTYGACMHTDYVYIKMNFLHSVSVAGIYFKNVTTDATSIGSVESGTSIYDTYDYFIHPHWKQFAPIPDHWHYIVGVYIMCVGITGVIGNGIVIWIFGTLV